ncbi:hypothetical protein [Marinisporobacter balticus]|uniref:Uncharacterized protein n=1 Tax=Marinisporobacter balticus TaxID=2018667 RepID=A0A4R2KIH4_9FIRM|nr:hypothetical protein [Marinisporobacter balticus]TCO72187.1 hypothetical protein EV214_11951 [Marinisporobacter balticus]
MAKRKDIEIKTKYSTLQELVSNCRDIKKKTIYSTKGLGKAQISGEVYADGRFELSSTKDGGSSFEFIGKAEEREDGVYMVGEIKPKGSSVGMAYMVGIVGVILGLFLMLILMYKGGKSQALVMGLAFFLAPVLNILHLKRSDALYEDIIRKVS